MTSKRNLSGQFTLALSLALSSCLISITVRAEENIYLKESVVKPAPIKKSNSVNKKLKVITPGGGVAPVGADFNDKAPPPGGPTFGESKGGFVNFKKPEQGDKISNPASLKTRPSAGQTLDRIQQKSP